MLEVSIIIMDQLTLHSPLHPGEVYPPVVPVLWSPVGVQGLLQDLLHRHGDLHRPEPPCNCGVVESLWRLNVDPAAERRLHIEAVRSEDSGGVLVSSVSVRFGQEQDPGLVQSVDFELFVVVVTAVNVNEHLEVIIVEDDLILLVIDAVTGLGDVGPDLRLLHLSSNIEPVIVPPHLHPRPQSRHHRRADILKVLRPADLSPGLLVKLPINNDRGAELVGDGVLGIASGEAAVQTV